jgi:hypothetical protein
MDRSDERRIRVSPIAAIVVAILAIVATLAIVELTQSHETATAYINSLDTSYSNRNVASECMGDLDRVAETAASEGSPYTFFAYDGDPLSRRGISEDFGAIPIPSRYSGTKKVRDYRVGQIGPVLEEMESQAEKAPQLVGTPLKGVLTRIARIGHEAGDRPKHAVNCGDGIWTDLKPTTDPQRIEEMVEEIPSGLQGMTIDFIGLSASAEDTGQFVERLRPRIEEVLELKHAHLGVYDIELPASWPDQP